MSRKMIIASLMALMGLAMSLAALSARSEDGANTIEMDPGDQLVLKCFSGFVEHEYQGDPGYYDVECNDSGTDDSLHRHDSGDTNDGSGGFIIMEPGARIVVTCDAAFIEHGFNLNPGYYHVECDTVPNTPTPEPTNTPVPPTVTPTPTEAEQEVGTVEMSPGSRLVVTCDTQFEENEFQRDPGYYDVECVSDGADYADNDGNGTPQGVETVDMNPGDRVVISCETAFVEKEFQGQPGYYDVLCMTDSDTGPTTTPEPTATTDPGETPVPTVSPEPTATPEPTAIPDPTQEPGSGNGACGESTNSWHPPVVNGCAAGHEHGAAPPSWATQFSQENFGHGIIYGGDEGTPNENVYKHPGFKGYHVTFDGAEIYFRMHMMATPLGHQGRYHSYEAYALDPSGNVSFWQGWLDFGTGNSDSPTVRINGCEDTTVRPIMAVNVAEGCGAESFESWYSHPGGSGGWSWDMGINIDAPFFHGQSVNNPSDPDDMSSWIESGGNGVTRRIELAWYADRTSDDLLGQWFCATVNGDLLGSADGPQGCTEGLPQYIAPTMSSVAFPGNSEQRSFPDTGVTLPN